MRRSVREKSSSPPASSPSEAAAQPRAKRTSCRPAAAAAATAARPCAKGSALAPSPSTTPRPLKSPIHSSVGRPGPLSAPNPLRPLGRASLCCAPFFSAAPVSVLAAPTKGPACPRPGAARIRLSGSLASPMVDAAASCAPAVADRTSSAIWRRRRSSAAAPSSFDCLPSLLTAPIDSSGLAVASATPARDASCLSRSGRVKKRSEWLSIDAR